MKNLTQAFVCFTLDNQNYALPCSNIHRILKAVEVTSLPNEEKNIAGVINIHGRIVPVINIRHMLEIIPKEIAIEDYIIVVEDNKNLCSFVVEETNFIEVEEHNIVSMKDVIKNIINDNTTEINKKGQHYVKGIIKGGDRPIYILYLKKIWQKIGQKTHEV